jgi:hypothetical protein
MKPIFFWLIAASFLAGCSQQTPSQPVYQPGLGEIMTQTSYRHGKLWFAGQAENWDLGQYELEEIEEGFADASQFHPSHKNITAIPELIAKTMAAPIKQTGQAIQAKNLTAFTAGYDSLTAGCNACHQATGFGFNVIVRPIMNVFPNQLFNLR